ncbi:MAG: NAD(P)-dependent oxidoreductase [Nitrospirae bacterium]|nr:MAG: NAD(P)-dependent oxidoreductase [Nitrospirota bacterium]
MRLSLIGTGLMGRPMAERLLERGHMVTVFNRTRSKAEPLRAMGASIAETPEEAIAASSSTILMLADYSAIEAVLFSRGAVPPLRDKTIVQMGTIKPIESQTLCRRVEEAKGRYLEAPVLGSKTEARAGTLIVMVGGTDEDFVCGRSWLMDVGSEIVHVGPVGKAAVLKLALNQLIASHIAAFSLSLGLIQRSEIDIDLLMQVVRKSALFAPMFEKKLPRLLARDYTNPNFPTKYLLKDVHLCREEAQAAQLNSTVLVAIENVVEQAIAKGLANDDYSALYEVIAPNPMPDRSF